MWGEMTEECGCVRANEALPYYRNQHCANQHLARVSILAE